MPEENTLDELYLVELSQLTGLAQRRVVKMTPIKGHTTIIFEVNLGKNSFAKTAR